MDETSMNDVRDKIVQAVLPHVPFDGWSLPALERACSDAGFDQSMVERVFPAGPVAAIIHFFDYADRCLINDTKPDDFKTQPLPARIAWLVKRRLDVWTNDREAVRRGFSTLCLPVNSLAAAKATWRTIDRIWHEAGDQSADFSWYSKRMILTAIYSSTLLVWLDDQSEDCNESWSFLNRRLANLKLLPKAKNILSSLHLPTFFKRR